MMTHRTLPYGVGLLIFLFLLTGCAVTGEREIPGNSSRDASNPVIGPIQVYQRVVSSVNGQRCPMSPSCSHYSIQAFSKHGYLMGWIMTTDRLLRCGRDEIHLSETRIQDGAVYSHDPVGNNDFWWPTPLSDDEKRPEKWN